MRMDRWESVHSQLVAKVVRNKLARLVRGIMRKNNREVAWNDFILSKINPIPGEFKRYSVPSPASWATIQDNNLCRRQILLSASKKQLVGYTHYVFAKSLALTSVVQSEPQPDPDNDPGGYIEHYFSALNRRITFTPTHLPSIARDTGYRTLEIQKRIFLAAGVPWEAIFRFESVHKDLLDIPQKVAKVTKKAPSAVTIRCEPPRIEVPPIKEDEWQVVGGKKCFSKPVERRYILVKPADVLLVTCGYGDDCTNLNCNRIHPTKKVGTNLTADQFSNSAGLARVKTPCKNG